MYILSWYCVLGTGLLELREHITLFVFIGSPPQLYSLNPVAQTFWGPRELHPNQKFACFVLYLKIINTILKNNICIL